MIVSSIGAYVGGKVPRQFVELNRLFLQHLSSNASRPSGGVLGRDLSQMAAKCGLKDNTSSKLAYDYMQQRLNLIALDLKPLGIADKLYCNYGLITYVSNDLLMSYGRAAIGQTFPGHSLVVSANMTVHDHELGDELDMLVGSLVGAVSETLLRKLWTVSGRCQDDSDDEEKSEQSKLVSQEEHTRYRMVAQALDLLLKVDENTYCVPALLKERVCTEIDARSVANTQALLVCRVQYDYMPCDAFPRLLVAFARHLPEATLDYLPSPSHTAAATFGSAAGLKRILDIEGRAHIGNDEHVEPGDVQEERFSDCRTRDIATIYANGIKVTFALVDQRNNHKTRTVLLAAFSHRKQLSVFVDCLVRLEEELYPGLYRRSMHFRRDPEWYPWPTEDGRPMKVETWRSAADSRWGTSTVETEKQVSESLSRLKMSNESQTAFIALIHSCSSSLWPNRRDFPIIDKRVQTQSSSAVIDASLIPGSQVWAYREERRGDRKMKSADMQEADVIEILGNKLQVRFAADGFEQIVPISWLNKDCEQAPHKLVQEFSRIIDGSQGNGISYDDREERKDGLNPVDFAHAAVVFLDRNFDHVLRSKRLLQRVLEVYVFKSRHLISCISDFPAIGNVTEMSFFC
jgi:hypothetical protein